MYSEKNISIETEAPYWSNSPKPGQITDVWMVFHGYGQLSRFFAKRLDFLDQETTLILAPQGLSQFYLGSDYGKVGASWLTKENRELGIRNQLRYLDQLFHRETAHLEWSKTRLHLMGFSQGVATMLRWAFHAKRPFSTMIIWAGGIPIELAEKDRSFLKPDADICTVIGKEDQFYNEEGFQQQLLKGEKVFGRPIRTKLFEGTHEVKREVLQEVLGM